MERKNFTHREEAEALIERFGGSAGLARILGFTGNGGIARVNNWKSRGIPLAVKLAYPEIFLQDLIGGRRKAGAKQK